MDVRHCCKREEQLDVAYLMHLAHSPVPPQALLWSRQEGGSGGAQEGISKLPCQNLHLLKDVNIGTRGKCSGQSWAGSSKPHHGCWAGTVGWQILKQEASHWLVPITQRGRHIQPHRIQSLIPPWLAWGARALKGYHLMGYHLPWNPDVKELRNTHSQQGGGGDQKCQDNSHNFIWNPPSWLLLYPLGTPLTPAGIWWAFTKKA